MGSSLGRVLYAQFLLWCVYMHWCKQSSRWKNVFDTEVLEVEESATPVHLNIPYKKCEYNYLPEDGPMRFETCIRRQKFL